MCLKYWGLPIKEKQNTENQELSVFIITQETNTIFRMLDN